MAGRKGAHLRTVQEVSSYLTSVFRQLDRDEIDAQKAGRLAYIYNILKGCQEAGDLKKRLEALDQQAEAKTWPKAG